MKDASAATDPRELERLFMDPCRAKSEPEWWAVREIEHLRAAVLAEREACAQLADKKAADDRRRGAALAKVVDDEDEEDTLQSYEDFAITAEVIADAIRSRSKTV